LAGDAGRCLVSMCEIECGLIVCNGCASRLGSAIVEIPLGLNSAASKTKRIVYDRSRKADPKKPIPHPLQNRIPVRSTMRNLHGWHPKRARRVLGAKVMEIQILSDVFNTLDQH
jgi:hypothetical protein